MAKLIYENWKPDLEIKPIGDGYIVEGYTYQQLTSKEHGKSKGIIECPCCGTFTEVFIWSFNGCGKRCDGCNVLLGRRGAYIKAAEEWEIKKSKNT